MDVLPFWKGFLLVLMVTIFSLLILAAALAILVFFIRSSMRKYKYVDLAVFEWLQSHSNAFRNRVILLITFLGSHQFLIPANLALLGYFLFIRKYSWFSIRVATIALSSLALMLLLKYLFKRKRPLFPLLKAAKGLSFPSGHAITAVSFYGLIIYIIFHTMDNNLVKYILGTFFILLIILIGFSRIYLRVHYLSDVLAGFIVGILWLNISLAVLNILEDYITGSLISSSLLPSAFPCYHQSSDLKIGIYLL